MKPAITGAAIAADDRAMVLSPNIFPLFDFVEMKERDMSMVVMQIENPTPMIICEARNSRKDLEKNATKEPRKTRKMPDRRSVFVFNLLYRRPTGSAVNSLASPNRATTKETAA